MGLLHVWPRPGGLVPEHSQSPALLGMGLLQLWPRPGGLVPEHSQSPTPGGMGYATARGM